MVKQAYANWADPCECPRDFPKCVCGKTPLGEMPTKQAIVASKEELQRNPRSRSAKLRIFQKSATIGESNEKIG